VPVNRGNVIAAADDRQIVKYIFVLFFSLPIPPLTESPMRGVSRRQSAEREPENTPIPELKVTGLPTTETPIPSTPLPTIFDNVTPEARSE